jgi:hypothetical protein
VAFDVANCMEQNPAKESDIRRAYQEMAYMEPESSVAA